MRKILLTVILASLLAAAVGGTTAYSVSCAAGSTTSESKKILLLDDGAEPQPLPAFAADTTAESSLASSAKSAYLFDADSKTLIFSKNENQRLTIASMTKIMLLNLVFEAVENGTLSLDETITVSERASSMGGSQVFLQSGKDYKASDLVKSVIVASANDASVALAERLYGSEEACVEEMNARRKKMGLTNTLFSNCTGLPKPTQYSSSHDVALMLCSLTTHEDYFKYSSIWLDELKHADGQSTTLTNTNRLVRFYNGCDGGKTGYTDEARFCLAGTAKRGGLRLIAVVIGEPSSNERFAEVTEMFDYGFANYTSRMILDEDVPLDCSVAVRGGKAKTVGVAPETSYFSFCKKNEKINYDIEFSPYENLRAPLKKGDKVGEITVFKDGVEVTKIAAVAFEDVKKKTLSDAIGEVAENWKI